MSIAYTDDAEQYRSEEYWAYPIETIYSQKGDCEDTTFLFSSIMKAMGYDTLVCYVQYVGNGGHAFAMIDLDSCGGVSYSVKNGNKVANGTFYCCETTPDNSFNLANVGCDILDSNRLSQSYCFMTDDPDTCYSIVVSRFMGF